MLNCPFIAKGTIITSSKLAMYVMGTKLLCTYPMPLI